MTDAAGVVRDDRYEVVVVRHGTREARRSEVFLNYAQYGEPDGPFVLDYYLWVVRSGTHTVLVDTGFARRAAEARGRKVLVDPGDAYRRLGVDTDAEVSIVVTHAHYDHIGNLDLFPNATVIASAAEVEFWFSPVSRKPLLGHFTEREEIETLARIDAEGRLRRFTGTTEAAPGVVVTEVGGHTPGQSMVTAPTSAGTVLLTSDAVHFTEELDRDMPFIAVTDLPAMYHGLQTVRDLVVAGEVDHVLTGHTAGVLDGLEPWSDDLDGVAGVIGRRQR